MVFHEIDSITDVNSGYRVIIYFIENKLNVGSRLGRFVEDAVEMLEKKNDDLLVIKIVHDSAQFTQLHDLYQPDVKEAVTLLAVNNKGIPLSCVHVSTEQTIQIVIGTMCTTCSLNCISGIEANILPSKIVCDDKDKLLPSVNFNVPVDNVKQSAENSYHQKGPIKDQAGSRNSDATLELTANTPTVRSRPVLFTRLQIRLPDGNKDIQQFSKDASLDEVKTFISNKYKLKEFELKTYNHENYSQNEYLKSLQELDLVPNGVIMVVVQSTVSMDNGWINTVFKQLKTNTIFVFGYLQGLVFMMWNSFFPSNNPINPRKKIMPGQNSGESRPNDGQQSSRYTASRSSSNIHTLRRNDDSDEENNRYNGNSTQQK